MKKLKSDKRKTESSIQKMSAGLVGVEHKNKRHTKTFTIINRQKITSRRLLPDKILQTIIKDKERVSDTHRSDSVSLFMVAMQQS